jgi:hypothetical protein
LQEEAPIRRARTTSNTFINFIKDCKIKLFLAKVGTNGADVQKIDVKVLPKLLGWGSSSCILNSTAKRSFVDQPEDVLKKLMRATRIGGLLLKITIPA